MKRTPLEMRQDIADSVFDYCIPCREEFLYQTKWECTDFAAILSFAELLHVDAAGYYKFHKKVQYCQCGQRRGGSDE